METGDPNGQARYGRDKVMGSTVELYNETKILMDLLGTEQDREHQIELIKAFLDKREELISDLTLPFSEGEQEQMKQLLDWNTSLLHRFMSLKQSIMKDMGQLKL
jgi:hypothetical protein